MALPPGHDDRSSWPAGLQSPTIYFHLRARQLQFQAGLACGVGRERVWRSEECAPSALLARRALPQLLIRLPKSYTNVGEVRRGAGVR